MRTLRLAGLAMIIFAAAAGSCAGPQAQPPSEVPLLTSEAETIPPADATELFPLEQRTMTFRVTEGDEQGQEVTYQLRPEGDHWVLSAEGRGKTFFRQNEQGDIVIFREDNVAEQVSVRYDPGITMLPAQVRPGETWEGESQMVVMHLDKDKVRDQGTVNYRLDLTARGSVEAPARQYRGAYLVASHRDIDLNLADAKVDIFSAYVPGTGQVAERVEQQRKVLGMFGSQSVEQMERAEPTQATQ
ncbi:MAG: hypothetical protein ACLFV3_10240 [Phycisphaeraceae bacterium]